MTTISDRAVEVAKMLGGRSDLTSRIYDWLGGAYIELGMGYDFEELEETVDVTITGTAEDDTYDYPSVAAAAPVPEQPTRAVKSIVLLDSTTSTTRVVPLMKKNVQWTDKLIPSLGVPAIWAPFKNSIILRPVPNENWTMRCRVWLKPVLYATVQDTVLNLPWDWLEILDYSAAIRGHIALMERDKANEITALLHGSEDPRSGRRTPGLIRQKLIRKQAESFYDDWGMRPVVRGYTKAR